ncbi:hypothetical protein FB451DRAFT_1077336 [Mycena latifolia]|nr:hypothetical protein FB451DRAFT_1077336 [Mycena latifolia]
MFEEEIRNTGRCVICCQVCITDVKTELPLSFLTPGHPALAHFQRSAASERSQTMYPVLTLPVEITTEIFLDCLPGSLSGYDTKPCMPLNEPPILLTRICRDWRTIALSTPQLWSHVRLDFGGKHGRSGYIDSWWVSFLGRWLSHAQMQPLSMSISNLTHMDPDEALIGLLDSYRTQWEDVSLRLPFSRFYQFSTTELLPILQRLELDACNIPRDVIDIPIAAFQHAPVLTHVRLDGWLRPSHFILPWVQLTSFELASASPSDCTDCLRRTPRLIKCAFDILEASGTAALALSVPTLHTLRSLTLSGPAPTSIFPYVVMPALEELDLAGRSLNASDLLGVQFFVLKSGCQLRRLHLYYISEALTKPAIDLLDALRALETLELAATEGKTISSVFHRLDDGGSFLPQLQHLAVSHHKMYDSKLPEMFRVVTGVLVRRETPSPEHVQLCSFSLTMQHEETAPSSRIRERWRGLVERGMKLSIKNKYESWI